MQPVQINFIFNDNVHILCLSCNIKKSKTTAKLSENSWNKRCSKRFQKNVSAIFYYHFFLLLNRNKVPEKLYFGQWQYTTKMYRVNAIWLLKKNQCRIKKSLPIYSSPFPLVTVWPSLSLTTNTVSVIGIPIGMSSSPLLKYKKYKMSSTLELCQEYVYSILCMWSFSCKGKDNPI